MCGGGESLGTTKSVIRLDGRMRVLEPRRRLHTNIRKAQAQAFGVANIRHGLHVASVYGLGYNTVLVQKLAVLEIREKAAVDWLLHDNEFRYHF